MCVCHAYTRNLCVSGGNDLITRGGSHIFDVIRVIDDIYRVDAIGHEHILDTPGFTRIARFVDVAYVIDMLILALCVIFWGIDLVIRCRMLILALCISLGAST